MSFHPIKGIAMQNLSAAVELAKEKGYSLSGLSVSLGHNKNYVSRILTRGASEETIEKVANEILQLLNKDSACNVIEMKQDIAELSHKLQDSHKILESTLKTVELQKVAFQELEHSYNDLKSNHNALHVKLGNTERHAAKLEANTIELAEQNHELIKQKNWAHTQLEQANAHVSGLRQLNQKYKAEARLASAFAAFFGFLCVVLGATLIWVVM